jgi:hypothetical protein
MISTASAELPGDGQHWPMFQLGQHFADQPGEPAAEGLEHGVDLGRGEAGAEFIDQRIVGREIA